MSQDSLLHYCSISSFHRIYVYINYIYKYKMCGLALIRDIRDSCSITSYLLLILRVYKTLHHKSQQTVAEHSFRFWYILKEQSLLYIILKFGSIKPNTSSGLCCFSKPMFRRHTFWHWLPWAISLTSQTRFEGLAEGWRCHSRCEFPCKSHYRRQTDASWTGCLQLRRWCTARTRLVQSPILGVPQM